MTVNSDASDPLYLHPLDHPGMSLVSNPFDGTRFGTWRKSMAIALSVNNKLGFVTGKVKKPDEIDDMVTLWILNALSRDIAEGILYSDSVKDIWSELEDRFGQSNSAKLYQLQKDLISINQGTSDIATYYPKIERFWDELSAVLAYITCTCGAVQSISKFEQDQRLIQFLLGLNNDYNSQRQHLDDEAIAFHWPSICSSRSGGEAERSSCIIQFPH